MLRVLVGSLLAAVMVALVGVILLRGALGSFADLASRLP